MNHATRFKICSSSNYWYLRHYLTPQKRHIFNYFVLEMSAIIAAENRERLVEERGFVPHILI